MQIFDAFIIFYAVINTTVADIPIIYKLNIRTVNEVFVGGGEESFVFFSLHTRVRLKRRVPKRRI